MITDKSVCLRQLCMYFANGGGNAIKEIFQYVSPELRADKDFMLQAVVIKGECLQYASEELRGDKEVVLTAIAQDGASIQYATKELRSDRYIMLAAMRKNKEVIQYAPEELRSDKEFMLTAIRINKKAMKYTTADLRSDRDFMIGAAKLLDKNVFYYASNELMEDKKFVLDTVSQGVSAVKYASKKLKADKEFMLSAMDYPASVVPYASKELRDDREFMQCAISRDWRVIKYATEELRSNKNFMLSTIAYKNRSEIDYVLWTSKYHSFNDISPTIFGDLVGDIMQYIPENLRHDKDFMLSFITQDWRTMHKVAGIVADESMYFFKDAMYDNYGYTISKYIPQELKIDQEFMAAIMNIDETLFNHIKSENEIETNLLNAAFGLPVEESKVLDEFTDGQSTSRYK